MAEEGSHWIAGLPVTPVKSVNVDVQWSPITSYLSQLLRKEATMHKFADKSFRSRDTHGVVCRVFLFEGTQEKLFLLIESKTSQEEQGRRSCQSWEEAGWNINRNYLPPSPASHTAFYCSILLPKPNPKGRTNPAPGPRLIGIIAVVRICYPSCYRSNFWEWRVIAAICALTCKDIWASSPVSWPRHESRLQTRADVSSMFICCSEWSSIRVLAGHPIRDERVSRGGQVGRLGSRQEQIVAKQLEPSCNLACTEALGLLTTTRPAKTHILMLSTKCLFSII